MLVYFAYEVLWCRRKCFVTRSPWAALLWDGDAVLVPVVIFLILACFCRFRIGESPGRPCVCVYVYVVFHFSPMCCLFQREGNLVLEKTLFNESQRGVAFSSTSISSAEICRWVNIDNGFKHFITAHSSQLLSFCISYLFQSMVQFGRRAQLHAKA